MVSANKMCSELFVSVTALASDLTLSKKLVIVNTCPAGKLVLRHRDDGVHEGVCVHTGVYSEGHGVLHVGSDQLNLGIPTALWHQDVGVLCSHLEQLCW